MDLDIPGRGTYKQHILTDKDDGQTTTITINTDGTITLSSPSGDSGTVSDSTPSRGYRAAGPRPFWAIAHRVLTKEGLLAALHHGANAIEIDVTSHMGEGWFAEHDPIHTRLPIIDQLINGLSIADLLTAVADARRSGHNIKFVWFDIKTADLCGAAEGSCNIENLRTTARKLLEPAGVKILWGFQSTDTSARAFQVIRHGLVDNEAIAVDGLGQGLLSLDGMLAPHQVKPMFSSETSTVPVRQRVWTAGYALPGVRLGSCEYKNRRGESLFICPQIRHVLLSRDYGRVFGWTITKNHVKGANVLMEMGVDGLIYGNRMTCYNDGSDTREALGILTDWLDKNGERRYLATLEDEPW
ncbi:phospholipase D [Ophiocordyceps camponoti-floridani]|uniref:Phospholipase D n=1 Tax=Ophiocordyceps camponoti-floridani TaxID=2030778 RepID=A0A8H4VDA4_9HYPO|nr:phospholipase D [Ophiocordyceps camponoti-floridani]